MIEHQPAPPIQAFTSTGMLDDGRAPYQNLKTFNP